MYVKSNNSGLVKNSSEEFEETTTLILINVDILATVCVFFFLSDQEYQTLKWAKDVNKHFSKKIYK